jgi:hypothetical protein
MRRLDSLIHQSWFENCPAITHAKDSDESDKSIPVEKKQDHSNFQVPKGSTHYRMAFALLQSIVPSIFVTSSNAVLRTAVWKTAYVRFDLG